MNQPEDRDHPEFALSARRMLRHSEVVDSATAAKLAAARQHALTAANAPRMPVWVPATALAAAALVAVMISRPQQVAAPSPVAVETQSVDTLDLLTDDMSPAFYRDLEFYRWLAQERPNA